MDSVIDMKNVIMDRRSYKETSNLLWISYQKKRGQCHRYEKCHNGYLQQMCSTDEIPKHELCPEGEDSWCKWTRAEALEEEPNELKYPQPLHPDVQKHILPIYKDLSNDDLL